MALIEGAVGFVNFLLSHPGPYLSLKLHKNQVCVCKRAETGTAANQVILLLVGAIFRASAILHMPMHVLLSAGALLLPVVIRRVKGCLLCLQSRLILHTILTVVFSFLGFLLRDALALPASQRLARQSAEYSVAMLLIVVNEGRKAPVETVPAMLAS